MKALKCVRTYGALAKPVTVVTDMSRIRDRHGFTNVLRTSVLFHPNRSEANTPQS